MKVAFFSSRKYEIEFFEAANQQHQHELKFFETKLNRHTVSLAQGYQAICCFVNDQVDAAVIEHLATMDIKLIALRSAGFNHVDLDVAHRLGMSIMRVPQYSPYAVAEHAVSLILALNRKIHRAHNRIRESDFSLHGLMGFDLNGCTVGVIGTGTIGQIFAKIMLGFGCKVIAYDVAENPKCIELGVEYQPLDQVVANTDIISLHCPLNPQTDHLINKELIAKMRPGVMLINTSRGALIETKAAIYALKTGQIGYLGLDVYEEEGDLFFEDLSDKVIQDDVFARLQTFPNVIITGHQAFFTKEAMQQIAKVTLQNISDFDNDVTNENLV